MKLELAAVARPAPIVSLALLAVAAMFWASAGCSSGEQCKSVVPAQTCASGGELQICADVSNNACHFEVGGSYVSCDSCDAEAIATCEQSAYSECEGTGSSSGISGSSSGYSGSSSGGVAVTCYPWTGGGTCQYVGYIPCSAQFCCPEADPYYCSSLASCSPTPCSEGECVACQ